MRIAYRFSLSYQFGSINVISEREECIGSEGNTRQLLGPFTTFGIGQRGRSGTILEIGFELLQRQVLSNVAQHKVIDGIRDFGTFDTGLELQRGDTWMLTQPPVGFIKIAN